LGRGQKEWAGTDEGAGWGSPHLPRGFVVAPRTIFGQNSAFWFVLAKKMCSSMLDRNINTCHRLLVEGVRDMYALTATSNVVSQLIPLTPRLRRH